MSLYESLCKHIIEKNAAPEFSAEQLLPIAMELLEMILAALQDQDLDDRMCFMRIEEIVQAYEKFGVSCGFRHDFG